jgi:hypothetical protein
LRGLTKRAVLTIDADFDGYNVAIRSGLGYKAIEVRCPDISEDLGFCKNTEKLITNMRAGFAYPGFKETAAVVGNGVTFFDKIGVIIVTIVGPVAVGSQPCVYPLLHRR